MEGSTLNEFDLHPLTDPAAPGNPSIGGVDFALDLPVGLNFTTGEHLVNGIPYTVSRFSGSV